MRIRIALFAFLSLVPWVSRGHGEPSSPPPVEGEILELEAAWNEAHLQGDAEVLDQLWAPELSVIVPGMQPFRKPDLLQMWRSMKVAFTRYETSDLSLRSAGETAVVTGRLLRSRDFGGQARDEDWLFTKTYARVDGQWKVLAYHASTTPSP